MMEKTMTPKERAVYDAKADREAWNYAWNLLDPLVDMAREVGHDEFTQVMEKALAEVEGEVNRTLDVLESLVERGDERGATNL